MPSITLSNKSESKVRVSFFGYIPGLDTPRDSESGHYIEFSPLETKTFKDTPIFRSEILPKLLTSSKLFLGDTPITVAPEKRDSPISKLELTETPKVEEPVAQVSAEVDLSSISVMSKTELQDVCLRIGLDTIGSKSDLLSRITKYKEEKDSPDSI